MSFISKIIPSKKILIIDVWTYKVKVAICEFKNWEINIVNIWEKKQEVSNIYWSEIANIEWVTDTISQTINKTLKNYNFNPKNIIINIPTSTIISCWEKIDYERLETNEEINIDELDYIIWKIEKKALEIAKTEIIKKTGFLDVDMKLITSSITQISIDWLKVSNPIWFTWKNISLSTLNVFIPVSRYNIIQTISNHLNKNISSIVPLEFCIPKLLIWSEYYMDDVLFLDIWNTKTSIIIQKKWVTIWFDRIEIWINDLIKNIKTKHNLTTINIVKNLEDKDKFLEEKNEFLEVWETWLMISIKEILKENINIPTNILITWGWNLNFIKQRLKNIDTNQNMLYLAKEFNFIDVDTKKLWIKENDIEFNSSNYWLLSLILATRDIVESKQNKVLDLLKNFLDQNEL